MAVKFLSDEWVQLTTDTLNADEAFSAGIANVALTIQFNVTDVPERGDVDYHVVFADGAASVTPGVLDGADVTVSNNYETAAAISKGDLNTQAAFMTGKLKVSGNLAKLMMNQGALTNYSAAVAEMDVDY